MRKSLVEKTISCFREGIEFFPPPELRSYFFALAMAAIGVFSLFFFWKMAKGALTESRKRYDLFKVPGLERMVKQKRFSFYLRLLPALLFIFVVGAGILGSARSNIAAPFVWLFWWTLLIFFVAFGGKIFCAICPWDFFANLFQFGTSGSKKKALNSSLNKKLPKALANIYPAAFLFILITWLELGFNITQNSFLTAVMGATVLLSATTCALIFEKRSFCRYLCPVGRVSGLYSLFSPMELRPKSLDVCKNCVTKECVKGSSISTACPTGLLPFKFDQNTYCTLCTECVRSCQKSNLTLKLRPFGSDLVTGHSIKKDEKTLIFLIVSLTFFHGLTMNGIWESTLKFFNEFHQMPYLYWFSLLLVLFLGLTWTVAKGFQRLIRLLSQEHKSLEVLVVSFIPVVLGFHLAHNAGHLFNEVGYLVPLLNDPMGRGWDLFDLRQFSPSPLMTGPKLFLVEQFALATGAWFGLKTLATRLQGLQSSGRLPFKDARRVYAAYVLVFLFLMAVSLFFVMQPMAEKGG